jgi:hypothetical protein
MTGSTKHRLNLPYSLSSFIYFSFQSGKRHIVVIGLEKFLQNHRFKPLANLKILLFILGER